MAEQEWYFKHNFTLGAKKPLQLTICPFIKEDYIKSQILCSILEKNNIFLFRFYALMNNHVPAGDNITHWLS